MTDPAAWGAIFDMDGVLIDSYDAHFTAWQETLAAAGQEFTLDMFQATFGMTNAGIFAKCFPSLPRETTEPLGEEKEAAFRRILRQQFPEMDGAGELLTALDRAGARLAIGSSGPPENVQALLDAMDTASLFGATVNGRDVTHGKPDPEVFCKAAARLDLPPGRCVVVEDAPAGVRAGKAAGSAVVALTGTVDRPALDAAGADLVVDALAELTPETMHALLN
jgi:beta-phosphoglucomutase